MTPHISEKMMADAKLNSGFEIGCRVRPADGCDGAGRCGSVIGDEVHVDQWWCPVLWDDEEDPDFSKSSCLEPLGALTADDWDEVLHSLTREIKAITPDNPVGMRRDRIMGILGKVASGDADKLDTDELCEIRRSLERDAPNCIDGGVGLRTICGKFGHAELDPWPKRLSPHVEEVLARLYVDESDGDEPRRVRCAVAKLCDEELDRSGGLLGRVRDRAAKLGGKGWAKATTQQG